MTTSPSVKRRSTPATLNLIETKLGVPALPAANIWRTSLLERLGARRAPVVTVVAPSGYGKTTLLSQWAARDRRPFAWLSLDHRDNDSEILLAHLAEALDRVLSRRPSRAGGALRGTDRSIWGMSVVRLAAAVAAASEPFVIAIDDLQEVTSPESLDAVSEIAGKLPAGAQLAIATRDSSQLPAGRLRAAGRLLELTGADLALAPRETEDLLHALGAQMTRAEVEELHGRLEGWPAGVHLAALARADPTAAATFAGDDRFVTDYLRSELLTPLSPKDARFVMRAAVLHRMSGPLCDAALDRRGSARKLEELERANRFVFPLDHRREWFRFHHLVREMLVCELERVEPDEAARIHGAASDWYARQRRAGDALAHAVEARDPARVARVAAMFPLPSSIGSCDLEGWLTGEELNDSLTRHPAIGVLGTWVHAHRGHAEDADRFATSAGRAGTGARAGAPALLRALLSRTGADRMRADAETAAAKLGVTHPWHPQAVLLRGIAAALTGDALAADAHLTEAVASSATRRATEACLVGHTQLALLALERGDRAAAEAHVEAAWAVTGAEDDVTTALLLAVTARLAIGAADAAAALQALDRAESVRPLLTDAIPWLTAQTLLELARTNTVLGRTDTAAALIVDALGVLDRCGGLGRLGDLAVELDEAIVLRAVTRGSASALTAAEFRLLPLLTTHLTFREIGERLFVSRNTVKTQAISIYRKLGVSSRNEAIERARALELVGPDDVQPSLDPGRSFIPKG